MKITGEMLKSERLNQNLSVQDVALSLKLTSKIITAIESGNMDDLPAKAFVRGFVKSYAQMLKLDPEVVLRQFQEEMGTTNPLPKVPPPLPSTNPIGNENNFKTPRPSLKQNAKSFSEKNAAVKTNYLNSESPKNIVLMISIATILIVLLVISNKVIDSFKSNPIAVDATAETKTNSVNPVTLLGTTTAISADLTNVRTPINSSDNSVTAVPKKVPPAEDEFEKSSGKPVELILEAKKDMELFYAKGDSTQFTALKMTANQIHIIRSKVGLRLKASDGSALKISVNGVDMGFVSNSNKAIKLTY